MAGALVFRVLGVGGSEAVGPSVVRSVVLESADDVRGITCPASRAAAVVGGDDHRDHGQGKDTARQDPYA